MLCFNTYYKILFTFTDHYIIHIPVWTGTLWKCSTLFPSLPPPAAHFCFSDVVKEMITQCEYPAGFMFLLTG